MPDNTKKKLAAIMFSKFVEFENYLSEDENFAVKILSDHDKILEKEVVSHNGRIIKNIDEMVFAEFISATDAINCSISIHNNLLNFNSKNSEAYQINVKVGIHMGEVYEKDGDLFGDGVNIASRIQPIAQKSGTVTSQAVYNAIRSDGNIFVRDMGRISLKNIKEPERVFKVYLDEIEYKKETANQLKENSISRGIELFDRVSTKNEIQSIAVLKIKNLGSKEDDFFCYGVTEDIILDVNKASRIKIPMIADVIKYEDSSSDSNSIAKQLGVEYLLTGNLMKMKNKFKLSLQLYCTKSGKKLWTEGWENDIKNIKNVRASIVSKSLKSIGSKVPDVILDAIKEKNEISPEAYELFLKAKYAILNVKSSADRELAQDLFKKAINLEPNYLEARYNYAMTMVQSNQNERAIDILDDALIIANQENDQSGIAGINTIYGIINVRWGKYQKAIEFFETALEQRTKEKNIQEEAKILNNLSFCFNQLGLLDNALEFANRSLDLKREISDKKGIAASLFSSSLIYRRISDYAKSIQYSKEAIELFEELDITLHDCVLKMNLGLYLVFVGNFNEAKENFNEAILKSKKMKDFQSLGMCHRGLGLIYLDQGQWSLAQKEFKQANKYHQKAEHTTAFEATSVFLGMTYFYEKKYDRAKELIDKAVMITQRRRDVSFYDTSARSAKILLTSKIGECKEKDIDEFCDLLIESAKVKQINRELYYASQAYLNIGLQEKADKYQRMCRKGLLTDSEKISDEKLRQGYLNKSLHRNMLNKKAVPFIQFVDEKNQQSESNKIEINIDNIDSLSKYCYEVTKNQFFNFCPNCSYNNTKHDFKFCPDCGTSLNKR